MSSPVIKRTTLYIEETKHYNLKIAAIKEGKKVNEIINDLIDKYLEENKHLLTLKE